MAESYRHQSALAHLHLAARANGGGAEVLLSERPFRGQVDLRGDAAAPGFAAAVKTAVGAAPPTAPNTFATGAGHTVLWLGPDEWLVVGADADESGLAARLGQALAGQGAAITEVGHSKTVIGLAGPRARDVLMKGASLDLHPSRFGPGQCAQTALARAGMLLVQTGAAPVYDLHVRRSFAQYVWAWLEDAAAEYGFAVTAG